MTYNIIWIVLQTIVMPFWWYRVRNDRPNAWKALAFVLILPIAAASEAMDFPPWGWLLDAHAIWHALTIPLGVMWGQFLLDDLVRCLPCPAMLCSLLAVPCLAPLSLNPPPVFLPLEIQQCEHFAIFSAWQPISRLPSASSQKYTL